MKLRITEYARELRKGLAAVVRLHPVETCLILLAGAGLVVLHEFFEEDRMHLLVRLLIALWYALPVFALGLAAGRGPWRRIYYAAWAPLLPLVVWSGLPGWTATPQFALTALVLTPLVVLLCRAAADNRRFVADASIYLRAAVLAALFANVALGLFQSIVWSAAYIFGLSDATWVAHLATDAWILAEAVAVPLLFLMMFDRWVGNECRSSRALEVLIGYIVTPALIAYAALLYLYAAKILVTWSLPRGGVAWMVFVFALLTLAVKGVRLLLDKRTGEWFYARFSLVMLPAAALFWAGVARRIDEYGLTTMRVYLLVCGAVMTLAVVLFCSRRTGRYLYLCGAAFLLFAAVAYVPQLDPERAALDSQLRRAQRIARSLDLLDGRERLRLDAVPLSDTVRYEEYRNLYQSLQYLWYSRLDTLYLPQLGLNNPDDFLGILPADFAQSIRYGRAVDTAVVDDSHTVYCYLPRDTLFATDARYGRVAIPDRNGSCLRNDTLFIRVKPDVDIRIAAADFLDRQLQRAEFDSWGAMTQSDAHLTALLDYRDEHCRILFDNIDLRGCDRGGWHISFASVGAVFLP